MTLSMLIGVSILAATGAERSLPAAIAAGYVNASSLL
jgi:hypothetical protein